MGTNVTISSRTLENIFYSNLLIVISFSSDISKASLFVYIFLLDFGLSRLTRLKFIQYHVAGFYKPTIPQRGHSNNTWHFRGEGGVSKNITGQVLLVILLVKVDNTCHMGGGSKKCKKSVMYYLNGPKVHPSICRITAHAKCQVRVFHNFYSKLWSKWIVPEKLSP